MVSSANVLSYHSTEALLKFLLSNLNYFRLILDMDCYFEKLAQNYHLGKLIEDIYRKIVKERQKDNVVFKPPSMNDKKLQFLIK